ncbi:TPA: restriction endonuclease subunit S [Yersinia enterocolitica]|nr:restriction endonuclease subunit S [Yersinia enterocolitica]HDM8448575.1 restriction endonuclease subunit S [Yersinia enterocolitica]
MGNIQRGYFSFEKVERLSASVEVEKENLANYGDFLFNTRNTLELVGKGATWMGKSNEFAFNNNIARFTLKGINTIFFNYLYNTQQMIKQVQARAMGTTSVAAIYPHNLKSIRYALPKVEEQTQIGNYFQKLDTLINQHQQKHNKLSNIKKAMLEKMFPKPGKTIPEIRFKGFSGEWEEMPFGACFINVSNNTLSRADLNYDDGMAKNIHYGDVLIKFGEVLDATNELLPFITNNDVANKLKHAALRDGDIIIADAAEDSMVGKCTELFNIGEQLVLSGLHTIAVRPTLTFASKYLGYYLNSSSYHDQLLSLMQGTKVLSISKTAIQNTNIVFPKSAEEQVEIGNYFQKLDALINQHQQQITKLNNIKQACLSKMFV